MHPDPQKRPSMRSTGAAGGQQQVRVGALNARPITGQQPNSTMATGAMPRAASGVPSATGTHVVVPAGEPAGAAGARQRQARFKFTQNMRNPLVQQVRVVSVESAWKS